MTLRQTKLVINQEGKSYLYIDGVAYGVFSHDQALVVKSVLNTLVARDADLSTLVIEEK